MRHAGAGDAHQGVGHHGTAANSFLPVLPAVPSAQLQQSIAAWGPYLALYQMQAMIGSPMSGPLGSSGMPTPEQAAAQQAQQAQHAFVLAVHQMAHSQSSMPLAAPQGAPESAALVTNGSMPLQGMQT